MQCFSSGKTWKIASECYKRDCQKESITGALGVLVQIMNEKETVDKY